MTSLKKTLHNMVDRLSESEARLLMNYAKQLHDRSSLCVLVKELSHDPAFAVSAKTLQLFKRVNPVRGRGVAASRLLINDRR